MRQLKEQYQLPIKDLMVGGFYTPSHQVENNRDNDGGVHPGSLQYYRTEFPKNGFQILSEYNFTYAACDYCPGEYWPDNCGRRNPLYYQDHRINLLSVILLK
jgi:hypothetical protein